MQWILNQVVKDYIPFHWKFHPTKELVFLLPPRESGINMRIMQSSCYRHLLTSLMEEQPLLFIQIPAAWLLIINMTALIWRCFLPSWKHIIIRFSSSLTLTLYLYVLYIPSSSPLHHYLLILMDLASWQKNVLNSLLFLFLPVEIMILPFFFHLLFPLKCHDKHHYSFLSTKMSSNIPLHVAWCLWWKPLAWVLTFDPNFLVFSRFFSPSLLHHQQQASKAHSRTK